MKIIILNCIGFSLRSSRVLGAVRVLHQETSDLNISHVIMDVLYRTFSTHGREREVSPFYYYFKKKVSIFTCPNFISRIQIHIQNSDPNFTSRIQILYPESKSKFYINLKNPTPSVGLELPAPAEESRPLTNCPQMLVPTGIVLCVNSQVFINDSNVVDRVSGLFKVGPSLQKTFQFRQFPFSKIYKNKQNFYAI